MRRAWQFLGSRGALWRGLFFAALAIIVLLVVANGPIDAPFLYGSPDN